MPFEIQSRHLDGIVVVAPKIFRDDRGFFVESYRQDHFSRMGLPTEWVQDNHSGSVRGVVRGLHFQWRPELSKLMRVTVGSAFLVAVDIRKNSPTLGQWFGIEASAENQLQVYAPAGFARGFCVTSDWAEIQYKCTGTYNPECESGIRWNDPRIGIDWPTTDPILSEKDAAAQTLAEWHDKEESEHFVY